MNEFLRAVARVCGVHVSLHRIWCSACAVVSCGVLVAWIFVAGALRRLLHKRLSASYGRNLTGAVAHQGGRSARWRTNFEETAA